MSCHEVYIFSCSKLSCTYKITLIFTIFIICNYNYFSLSKIL